MHRFLLLSILLCLNWTVWGQTYDYRYWFDNDEQNQRKGTSETNQWHIDADLTGLSHTFHTIHFQVMDTTGLWSVPVTRYFIKQSNPNCLNGYYWFDEDFTTKTMLPLGSGMFKLDVSDLENKLHHVYFQYADNQGNATTPLIRFFFKYPKQEATEFYYWTDNNIDNIKTSKSNGDILMLDMTDEDDGFHVLHVIGKMDGDLTQAQSHMFIKIPQTEGVGNLTCLCYIDGKLYKQEKVVSKGGIIDWNLDVSSLSDGFHRILVQVVTPSGAATSVHESFFFRITMPNELSNMKLVYNIDGGEVITQAGDFGSGLFHFNLDVSDLTDGLHRLNYMLLSETGSSTQMNTSFFIKTPVGGPGIVNYKYWINNFEDDAVKVTLDKRQELFNLISLLPVKTCPIRSSCFHFEILEDGTPMMYAKNDFHIQFVDVKHYHLDAVRQYIDYNVAQPVENITPLESGKRVWKHVPDSNQVHWFQVNAVRGDSLLLKTDMACTLQMFSPTGKEVFSASGVETVKYDGCHAEEDGTYYVALHDVTGTRSENIALDFQHIDKYAVLRWDVSTVGNGGASTITYEGNGFDNLYAIDYVNASGDTINCNYKDYISDATTTATTDFSGASVGMYDAVFHFTTEDRIVKNALKVEEAKELRLEIDIDYPSTFLIGSSCTYNITVRNNGNSTAYMVPLELFMRTESFDNISNIKFKGALESISMPLLSDTIDDEELVEIIRDVVENSNDLCQFVVYKDTINKMDYGMSQVVLSIPPLSNRKMSIEIETDAPIELKAFMTKEWFPVIISSDYTANAKKIRSVRQGGSFCCVKERWQCAADAVAQVASIFGGHINCGGTVLSKTFNTVTDIYCSDGTTPSEKVKNYARSAGKSMVKDLIDTAVSCVTGYYKPIIAALKYDRDMALALGSSSEVILATNKLRATQKLLKNDLLSIYNSASLWISGSDCVKALTENKPNCPGNLGGGGGSSNPVNSYDPNDIYGYQAESGSKAIRKGLKELYYTIEFENDTAFATASAQNVYLTDTLDARYFDLKSFEPTSLKIGDKTVELDGNPNFVTTVDMRPSINSIAQVKCDYDNKKGIAKWHFSSLDPMTMEPVTYPMDGFLPINNSDGDGIGRVSFNINLRDDFEDGTEISNKASIVFDSNEAIVTPTWTNVVDTIAPQSRVLNLELVNDTTLVLNLNGTDNYSGVWKYDLYVKMGDKASWFKLAENITDSTYEYHINNEIDYHFCTVATDSAGNVEPKMLQSEGEISVYTLGDANNDKVVDAADVVLAAQWFLGKDVDINWNATNIEKDSLIDAADIVGIAKIYLSISTNQRVKSKRTRRTLWKE